MIVSLWRFPFSAEANEVVFLTIISHSETILFRKVSDSGEKFHCELNNFKVNKQFSVSSRQV